MPIINESWAPVPVDEFSSAYEVSSKGRIRSIPRIANSEYFIRHIRGGIMKGRIRRDGHRTVSLCFGRYRKQFYVKQLVADAFIPNPEGLPIVSIKDGNYTDCSVENLERLKSQCDLSGENKISLPSADEARENHGKAIIAVNIETGHRIIYRGKKSLRLAGFDASAVYACLSGRQKSHRGNIFIREESEC